MARSRSSSTRTLALAAISLAGGLASAGCRTRGGGASASATRQPGDPDAQRGRSSQAPTPADTQAEAGPPLSRDEIRVVVRAKMPEVRACFDAGLAEAPDIGGRVLLRFTINTDGRAGPVEIAEDELGASVAGCLAEAVEHWQFPRPRGGPVTIAYPFVFTSERTLRAAGLPRVEGTVKPAAVGAVFDARRSELDSCIPEAAAGSVGVAFVIDDSGAVTRISAYASTLDEPTGSCIVRTISSWAFPPAATGDEARVNHDLRW